MVKCSISLEWNNIDQKISDCEYDLKIIFNYCINLPMDVTFKILYIRR
jgi:hypothetical protein